MTATLPSYGWSITVSFQSCWLRLFMLKTFWSRFKLWFYAISDQLVTISYGYIRRKKNPVDSQVWTFSKSWKHYIQILKNSWRFSKKMWGVISVPKVIAYIDICWVGYVQWDIPTLLSSYGLCFLSWTLSPPSMYTMVANHKNNKDNKNTKE